MTGKEYNKASELEKILYDCTGMLAKKHPSIVEAMQKYATAINKNVVLPDVINCTELEPEFRQALDDLCKKFNKPTKKRF